MKFIRTNLNIEPRYFGGFRYKQILKAFIIYD